MHIRKVWARNHKDFQILKNRKHEMKCQNENIKLQCNLNAKQSIFQSSLLICSKRVTKKKKRDLISCAYNHKFLIIFLELLLQLALNLLHILEQAACNELNFHFSEIPGREETEFLLLKACRQVTSTLLCHFTTDGFTVQ